jgi:hypothetical protein
VCRFHVAASEKLHADKLSGAIVWSVAKLAGINLQKCGSFSYWFDNLGFTTKGKLAAVLIITLLLGFSNKFSGLNYTPANSNQLPIMIKIIVMLFYMLCLLGSDEY